VNSESSGSPSLAEQWWGLYTDAIDKWPILTKACTSAILAALGDALAQLVVLGATAQSGAGSPGLAAQSLDVMRLVNFALINGLLVGPTFHAWYGWLGTHVSRPGISGALLRIVPDQLVFSPLFLFVFLLCVRSLGAQPLAWKPPSLELWWTANCANWLVLPVTQFLNFWLVPLRLQVLYCNVIAVGMSAVMSYLAVAG